MRTRNNHVSVWMSDKELAHLKEQANLASMSVDPFIRNLVMDVKLRPKPPAEYTALLRELAAIGNNINQIAYWANARKSVHEAEIIEAAMLAKEA